MKKEASRELVKLIINAAHHYDTAINKYYKQKSKVELETLVRAYNCMRDANEYMIELYYYNKKAFPIHVYEDTDIEDAKRLIRHNQRVEEIKKDCNKENIDYDILSKFSEENKKPQYIVYEWFTSNYRIMYLLIHYYLKHGCIFQAAASYEKAGISEITYNERYISFKYMHTTCLYHI